MSQFLEVERNYIQANHKELARRYPDKFLVIQGCEVHFQADSFVAGADWGMANLRGHFLCRHVNHPEDQEILLDLSDLTPQGSAILEDHGRANETIPSGSAG